MEGSTPPLAEHLDAAAIWNDLDGVPLMESASRLMLGKGNGKLIAEDGTMKAVIIRPCRSRGARIGGQPPIYEAAMLKQHAGVFAGWPMYMDHMVEQVLDAMTEQLQESHPELLGKLKEARSVRELGGRVVKSEWDSSIVFEDDAEYGYQKGGVVGTIIPQPAVREMLEADPGILELSINAWPKGARRGATSWDSKPGMVIEGIKTKPMGSVDFVFRGGAGGRPILPALEERVVSLLESHYDPPQRGTDKENATHMEATTTPLAEMNEDQLREALAEQNPTLAESLLKPKGSTSSPAPVNGSPLTEERVGQIVAEAISGAVDQIDSKLQERESSATDTATALLQEREEQRGLQGVAFDALEEAVKNGLPEAWGSELKERYRLHADGPAPGLLVEAKTDESGTVTKSAADVLRERVVEDVKKAAELIAKSGGTARVKGLGANAADPNGSQVEESEEPGLLEESLDRWGVQLEEDDKSGKSTTEAKGS